MSQYEEIIDQIFFTIASLQYVQIKVEIKFIYCLAHFMKKAFIIISHAITNNNEKIDIITINEKEIRYNSFKAFKSFTAFHILTRAYAFSSKTQIEKASDNVYI